MQQQGAEVLVWIIRSLRRRNLWRETQYMHRELALAITPRPGLFRTLTHRAQIARDLAEPKRTRKWAFII